MAMDPGYDDPRAKAIDQLYNKKPNRSIHTKDEFPPVTREGQRDPQMMFPGMKGETDYQQQYGESPDFSKKRTIGDMMGMPDDGRGSQNDRDEAAAAADMSDEDLLATIQRQMAPPPASGMDNDVTNPDNWPDTPEEFEQKFGRKPTTDHEVEFYFGADDEEEVQMNQRGVPNRGQLNR